MNLQSKLWSIFLFQTEELVAPGLDMETIDRKDSLQVNQHIL